MEIEFTPAIVAPTPVVVDVAYFSPTCIRIAYSDGSFDLVSKRESKPADGQMPAVVNG